MQDSDFIVVEDRRRNVTHVGLRTNGMTSLCGLPMSWTNYATVTRERALEKLWRASPSSCLTCYRKFLIATGCRKANLCRHCGKGYRPTGRKAACQGCVRSRAIYRARIISELEARGGLLPETGDKKHAPRPRALNRKIDLSGFKF